MKKMKPIIGLSPLIDLELPLKQIMWNSYIEAIEDAGGIPIVLSIKNNREDYERLLDIIDGVLLPGGHDINPLSYGEDVSKLCNVIIPQRDEAELLLCKAAFSRGIPLLGICRGHQLINVALGGTLYQDITTQAGASIIHAQSDFLPPSHPIHSVKITKGTRLYDCFGCEEIMVNSLHHQAIKELASGLNASALSTDGIIEAMECSLPNSFTLGVQWHPEIMFRQDENARRIFGYFIEHCR